MAITAHVTTRIYGQIFGTPPFQNAAGQAAVTEFKQFPIAPLASVAVTPGVNLWPLQNGLQVGNGYYVYTILEFPPSGLNVNSVKLATDQSVTTLVSAAT
ncbi:MAG: hypothetical protein V4538_15180 [Bacteroidota bacterium]